MVRPTLGLKKGLMAGKGLRVTTMRWGWSGRLLARKITLGRKRTQSNYDKMADFWPEKGLLAGKKGHLAGKRLRITTMIWG